MNLKSILNFLFFLILSFAYSQENLHSSSTIPDHLITNANAVIRLNESNISINSQKELKVYQKRIVTVLNEAGNTAIQAYCGYDKYVKIKHIEGRIFNASGKEIKKIKKKDFIDHSAVDGGTLYSDSRVLFMPYTPVSYPYTVEFLCEVETSSTAAIPSWRPIGGYFVSVQKDVYKLEDHAGLGLRFKEKNLEAFNVNVSHSEQVLNYTLENQKPLKPEDLSPSFSKITPNVLVAVDRFHFYGVDGHAKNWLEFGDWINNSLLAGRNQVTEETKQQILNLVSDIKDPIDKAKKVFEFVQSTTRYISVQVGIGGVQPIPALEVDQLKYGDCKGLTNYTQALLKIAGVPSFYTIVESGSQNIVDFEEDFASLEQGNHIILAIPDDNDMLWVDCTSQLHPFNFIGDFTDNRNVLIVKPNASEIIKTKVYEDSLNYQSTVANIKLKPNGGLAAAITRKTKGIQYDNRFLIERKPKREIVEYYKEYWGNINGLEVLNYSNTNDKSNIEFTENVNVYSQKYASISGSNLIFSPNAFNKNTFIPNRYRNRTQPLEIQRGYLDEDTFSYQIPEGYQVEALPDNVSIKNKFGNYLITLSVQDNSILYKRTLMIRSGTFPKSDYTAYRDFRKKISSLDQSKIILKRK